jgi:hypothetical protein
MGSQYWRPLSRLRVVRLENSGNVAIMNVAPLMNPVPVQIDTLAYRWSEMMAKYRKKPVVIEAWQLPPNGNVVRPGPPPWLSQAIIDGDVRTLRAGGAQIVTREGIMRADVGDWIIQGVKGELYPCKPDIFAATYEPADSEIEAQ